MALVCYTFKNKWSPAGRHSLKKYLHNVEAIAGLQPFFFFLVSILLISQTGLVFAVIFLPQPPEVSSTVASVKAPCGWVSSQEHNSALESHLQISIFFLIVQLIGH